jgi:hypothetical protein
MLNGVFVKLRGAKKVDVDMKVDMDIPPIASKMLQLQGHSRESGCFCSTCCLMIVTRWAFCPVPGAHFIHPMYAPNTLPRILQMLKSMSWT